MLRNAIVSSKYCTNPNFSYRDDCESCLRFLPKWEYIGSQLKGRVNVAKVNVMNDGISTGSRFAVSQVPAFLL